MAWFITWLAGRETQDRKRGSEGEWTADSRLTHARAARGPAAEVGELMFPRAVAWLRQLVQGLLSPHVPAEGAGRKRKAHGQGGQSCALNSPVDALQAILQPTEDARECVRKLARVVCTWMQTLPDVRKLLRVRATSPAVRGSEGQGHKAPSVLAHLVYIAVLWHLLPSASQHDAAEARSEHQEEDKKIGDDLQAALLSGALRPPAQSACVQLEQPLDLL